MGIGEPLDNYDNVIKFLKLVNAEGGLNIGYRHISLSTCGLADKIYKLADENLPITLSISLHAATDAERSALMPINNKWNLTELLNACAAYFKQTGRRISFEYILLEGITDTPRCAEQLYELFRSHPSFKKNIPFHINLIPVNKVEERAFSRASKNDINAFAEKLGKYGINATVRRELGSDIKASCGQLRYNKRQNI